MRFGRPGADRALEARMAARKADSRTDRRAHRRGTAGQRGIHRGRCTPRCAGGGCGARGSGRGIGRHPFAGRGGPAGASHAARPGPAPAQRPRAPRAPLPACDRRRAQHLPSPAHPRFDSQQPADSADELRGPRARRDRGQALAPRHSPADSDRSRWDGQDSLEPADRGRGRAELSGWGVLRAVVRRQRFQPDLLRRRRGDRHSGRGQSPSVRGGRRVPDRQEGPPGARQLRAAPARRRAGRVGPAARGRGNQMCREQSRHAPRVRRAGDGAGAAPHTRSADVAVTGGALAVRSCEAVHRTRRRREARLSGH